MGSTAEGYLLEQGSYGLRAVLNSPWNQDIERSLLKRPIAELELNDGKGWRGQDLSFLTNFPELLAFKIIDLNIKFVSPIHMLNNLRALNVLTYCRTELRFDQFPHLVECGLEWRRGASSLFDRVGLKKLFVNRFTGSSADPFGRLRNLESLGILGSPIKRLDGLRPLKNLRSLRLGALRVLETLNGIEELVRLEKLEVNTCRKIVSIKEISSLANLRELYLDNMGDIESLKPLESLRKLRCLTFVGSTKIADGDLSPVLKLQNLEKISFQNRSLYSHRREDFDFGKRALGMN
jgi:Leucine-rich repeat (LRR) protein